ncbi:MAG: hypothetical protein Q8O99_06920 [bacterium]|nr:hypothetical protein [bacterium]
MTSYLYKLTEIMIAGDFHHSINFADPVFFPYYRVRDIRFCTRDAIKHPSRYLSALLAGLFVDKLTMQTNQIVARLAPHLPIYGVDLDEQDQPVLTVLREATL